MANSLPPLKALRVFEAVVRTRNLSAAAAELHVTHSAVSQQLKLLEMYFGQLLFQRSSRGVQPSEAALQFYAEVKSCLDRIALASEHLKAAGEKRVVKVNTTPSVALRWLIPRLSAFQMEQPRIEVRVATSEFDGIDGLKDAYDVIIRRDPHERSGYQCERFLDDVSVPLASPAYLERQPIAHPQDCLRASLLHLASRRDAWARWLGLAGIAAPQPVPGQVYQHFFLSLQAAGADLGVAIGSLALVEEDLASGRLVQLFPGLVLRDRGFHMLYRNGPTAGSALGLFVDWLRRMGAAVAGRPSTISVDDE